MAELVSIVYPDEQTAFEVRDTLLRLQKEYLIAMEDLVVVTKDGAGKVRLHQSNLAAVGVVSGGVGGSLIGALFLNPLLGLIVGAAFGAISGSLADYGIDDDFMRSLGETVHPGNAAIFTLIRHSSPDELLPELGAFGGTILHTSLTQADEERLRAALASGALASGQSPPGTPTQDGA